MLSIPWKARRFLHQHYALDPGRAVYFHVCLERFALHRFASDGRGTHAEIKFSRLCHSNTSSMLFSSSGIGKLSLNLRRALSSALQEASCWARRVYTVRARNWRH